MKKYAQIEVYILSLKAQDVITASGFFGEDGDEDGFVNPNGDTDPANFGA